MNSTQFYHEMNQKIDQLIEDWYNESHKNVITIIENE
jgi:hypothetical protein